MQRRQFWLPAMTLITLTASGVCLAGEPQARPQTGQTSAGTMIRQPISFNTEVSKVLAALARMANAGIVVSDDVKGKVAINLNNVTIDEAVRLVTAQAKVAYRKIGSVFVVAPVDTMQKVLEQYLTGTETLYPLKNIMASNAVTALKEAVPFVTARAAANGLLLVGAPEDLDRAKTILQSLDVSVPAEATESVSIVLTYAPAEDIQTVLTSQFPKLKAQKVGTTVITFTGPRQEVTRAQEFVKGLDKGKEANARYVVYRVKYVSPSALTNTLREAIQNLTVVTGPDSYYIPPTGINLLGTQGIGGSGGGNSGGGGGQGGGNSSGSSNGLGGSGGSGGSSGSSGGFGGSGGSSGGFGGGGQNGNQGGGQGSQGVGERTREIILGGTADAVAAALKLAESLDVPTPQVVLDVKVVSSSPQASQSLGIDWSNGGQGSAISASTTITERPNSAAADINGQPLVRDSFSLGNFARLPIQLSATLNAFFRREDVKILAKPTITALDNESGVVFVGETRRVSVSALPGTPGTGANAIVLNSVVEIPVGIILLMRPRVNENDLITLHVHPIYSTVSGVDTRTGLFNTQQREADTTVRVKSGETIVIGGLLQEEDTKTLIKVPILGDIPLIGQFFRNYSRVHLRREVLVFVTPHLLKD